VLQKYPFTKVCCLFEALTHLMEHEYRYFAKRLTETALTTL